MCGCLLHAPHWGTWPATQMTLPLSKHLSLHIAVKVKGNVTLKTVPNTKQALIKWQGFWLFVYFLLLLSLSVLLLCPVINLVRA